MFRKKPDATQFPVVLLVEEDVSVRSLIARTLRQSGYGVLEAKDSLEALLLGVQYHGAIAALITAIALCNYTYGAELVDNLRAARPDMRMVYMAAGEFLDEAIAREVIREEATLLPTPISAETLKDLAQSLPPAPSPEVSPTLRDWA